MSSHHDHDTTEVKTVSFTTPLILGLVTLLMILLLVSTCDNNPHGCEAGDGKHEHETHHSEVNTPHQAAIAVENDSANTTESAHVDTTVAVVEHK